MRWIIRLIIVALLAIPAVGCDQHDDHKGHNHKPGEKH